MTKFQKHLHKMPADQQKRTKTVLANIYSGVPLHELKCKYIEKTKSGNRFISYSIGMTHRLLVRKKGGCLVPVWVGSHSQYNNVLKSIC